MTFDYLALTENEQKHIANGGRVFCVQKVADGWQIQIIKKDSIYTNVGTVFSEEKRAVNFAKTFINLSADEPLLHGYTWE